MNTTAKLLTGLLGLVLLLMLCAALYLFYLQPRFHLKKPVPKAPPPVYGLTVPKIPAGITYANPYGTDAPFGYQQVSQDQSTLTFVGRIETISVKNNDAYAEIAMQDAKGNKEKQPFLFYSDQDKRPFLLQTQKTHDIYPQPQDVKNTFLHSAIDVVASLKPLLNKDAVFSLPILPLSFPSPLPGQLQLAKIINTYIPCNKSVYTNLVTGNQNRLSCTPYLYQMNIYVE